MARGLNDMISFIPPYSVETFCSQDFLKTSQKHEVNYPSDKKKKKKKKEKKNLNRQLSYIF